MIWQKIKETVDVIFATSSSYMPHGHCYLWQTSLVGLHIMSDALIAIAYFSIPAMLVYFAYQHRRFLPIHIFLMFGAFITLCGVGHLVEIWTLWHPDYWFSGIEKALTALVSCYTAASLVTLLPQFLSLRSPEELAAINQQLSQEVERRRAIAQELENSNHTLEQRVAQRTIELEAKNTALQSEIHERQTAEAGLAQQLACSHLLAKTLQQVWAAPEFSSVLQVFADDIRQFLSVDRVVLYQFQEDLSGQIITESVSQPVLSLLNQKIEDRCFSEKYVSLYQAGRIRVIENIETSDLQDCHKDLLRSLNVQANLVLPIVWDSSTTLESDNKPPLTLWGLLIAHSCDQPRVWCDFEIEVLQQLSLQLGIAIRQGNFVKRLKQKLHAKQQAELALQASEKEAHSKAESLAQTLAQLRATQAQLVQSEKMASLWQIVGGIAHEINNPLSFIYGNLKPAEHYMKAVFETIDLYQEQYPNPTPELADWFNEFDFEFMRDDFPKLLGSMKAGADRIRDIILLLRNFSRLDEADLKFVNLHDGLNGSLTLLSNRLLKSYQGRSIKLEKDYDLDIPKVQCYPGLLNQAIFGMLTNALDALENRLQTDTNRNFSPFLQVRTQLVYKAIDKTSSDEACEANLSYRRFVQIQIVDNGSGIPANLQQRIFDPFFTTKPIGQGKGLGLSSAYQIIVTQHQGDLVYQPDEQGNTRFIADIPIDPPAVSSPSRSNLVPYTAPTLALALCDGSAS